MMLTTLKETSIFVRFLKESWQRYCFFEEQLNETYKNSQTYRITQGLKNKIKVYFRYSFLGTISEIKENENNIVLEESKIVRYLINSYKKFKLRAISYFDTSIARSSLNELTKELYFSPIKNLSIIIVVAILINIIFSILLKKEIGLLGWFIRIFFLLIGLNGLSSNATWEDIKKTSYFIKQQNKKNTER